MPSFISNEHGDYLIGAGRKSRVAGETSRIKLAGNLFL